MRESLTDIGIYDQIAHNGVNNGNSCYYSLQNLLSSCLLETAKN
jgi:hypothetical protein